MLNLYAARTCRSRDISGVWSGECICHLTHPAYGIPSAYELLVGVAYVKRAYRCRPTRWLVIAPAYGVWVAVGLGVTDGDSP